MTMTSEKEQRRDPLLWSRVLATGVALGLLAGGIALFGQTWYMTSVPVAMMVAVYIAMYKGPGKGFWNGFIASFLCGLVGLTLFAVLRAETVYSQWHGRSWIQLASFVFFMLLPLQVAIGVIFPFFYGRMRLQVEQEKAKEEEERKARREQWEKIRANRPKKKYKKKKR